MNFTEANKIVHKVEDQWHYPILTKYGFVPVTLTSVGFVRSYTYTKGELAIVCNTGVNADYWINKAANKLGYWSDLEPHLKQLAG